MLITAHSGSDGTPENSIAFLRHALSLSADALEVDVHRRQDGTLVLQHNCDSSGQYAGCVTLAEAFFLISGRQGLGINCDLKDAGLEQAVCALHEKTAPGNPLLLSGTVSPQTLHADPTLHRRATVLLNAEEIVPHFYPRMLRGDYAACGSEAAGACRSCGAAIVNVFYWCCPPAFLQALRAQDIDVSVWTVDDPEEARYFAARRVFNLTTRHPEKLLEALGK